MHIGNRVADAMLVSEERNKVRLSIDGGPYDADIVMTGSSSCSVLHDGNSFNAEVISGEDHRSCDVNIFYCSYHVDITDTQKRYLRMHKGAEEKQGNKIATPMPDRVMKIPVWKGDHLETGGTVVVLGAVKMQGNYKVSSACVVKDILVSEGDSADDNQALVTLDLLKDDSYE